MTDNITKKNKKDWENFLSSSEKLHDKDLTANSNKTNISKSLDLHGFSLEEANKKVESFLNSCFDQGVSKVIIVTGKGLHSQNEKKIVSGDPDKIKKIYDTWVFSRDTSTTNPNWHLVDTLT